MIDGLPQQLISDLDPLVITSPVIRSGTTLLQRLLCSSPSALIYGELCAQDLEFSLNLYTFKQRQYSSRQADFASGLQKVLAGDANDWIVDLMPDIEQYLAALGQSAFAGVAYCRDYARQVGRPIWGFKCPAWQPATIHLLRAVMPRARFIFIHRDIVDCVKSAKAQHELTSRQELTQFCQAWVNNLTYMLSFSDDPDVLVVPYERLVTEAERMLPRLTQFAGVENVDASVMQRRINTFAGEDFVMQAPDGYTQPAELDDAEMQVVQATAASLRQQLYKQQQQGEPCPTN
jgi:hypothetical protein